MAKYFFYCFNSKKGESMLVNSIGVFSPNQYRYNSVKARVNTVPTPIYGVSFQSDGDTKYFDYDKELEKQMNKRSGFQKFFGAGKKKARANVEKLLIGFNMSEQRIANEKDKRISDNKELIAQQQKTIEALQKLTEEKERLYQEAKLRNEDQKTILRMENEIKDLKAQKKAEKERLDRNLDGLRNDQEIVTKREAGKGWDKIAGRKDLKIMMEEVFINKLEQEKNGYEVNMPNGILLYGPPGTGKTRFAQAFAEEAKCDFVSIDTLQDDSDILMDLRAALKHAKKVYNSPETPKKRTIILLDDFNSIAELSDEEKADLASRAIDYEDTNVGQLVEYLNNCADKYKATIFMTTNHPRRIDSEILQENLVPHQIFLGPPLTMDAAEMFKYHLAGFINEPIDYLKLGREVCKAFESQQAYSSQGIVNVVEYAKEHSKGSKITESALLDAIDHVKPDISSKTLNTFLDEVDDVLSRYKQKEEE